jgi:alkylhydroperoxidase family enzyme
VDAVLESYRTAPIQEAERALLGYVEKVNCNPSGIDQSDIDRLHHAGWTDEAIYDAIMVCGLFNFYNRWIDAAGVTAMSKADHHASGKRLASRGYIMSE